MPRVPGNRTGETFVFPPELGKRLRELRKQAGLTQRELANLIGRNYRGGQHQVSRLELGKLKSPALWLTADYRQVGCGRDDKGDRRISHIPY